MYLFPVVDYVVLDVILSFQDVSGWKLREIVRDLPQGQKGNSYCAPDSKWLAFTDREAPDKPLHIWLLDTETYERKRLNSNDGTMDFIGNDYYPSVSPDGNMVAFLRAKSLSQVDILLIPIEGGRTRILKSDLDRGNPLCWTPDSREVIFRIAGKMFRNSNSLCFCDNGFG